MVNYIVNSNSEMWTLRIDTLL